MDAGLPALRLRGICKRFGSVEALRGVCFEVRAGEIHALLGENGAGKTTLMNIACGLVRPDGGTMELDGRGGFPGSPAEARRMRIGMVHQHFTLVDRLTVAENLALSVATASWRLDRRAMAQRALDLAAKVGLEIGDPGALVGDLPVGARQRIEIVKALAGETRVLLLDEPTAVLTPAEVQQLFTVLRRLRDGGIAIALITHKLREARAVADRVSVLRLGRVVGHGDPKAMSDRELAALLVGSALPTAELQHAVGKAERLRLEGVRLTPEAAPWSLAVREGEVFGIVGVDGNGQRELFEILAGLRRPAAGRVAVCGREVSRFTPLAMLSAGLASIPPDRRADGLVSGMAVWENLVLNAGLLAHFSHWGILAARDIRRFAADCAHRFRIAAADVDAPVAGLSGGNQQRLLIARALATRPRVLVAVNPTRGLDVAATRGVYEMLNEFVAAGNSAVVISTDLDEALEISDRVAVLYRHRLSEPLERPFAAEEIGLRMAGIWR